MKKPKLFNLSIFVLTLSLLLSQGLLISWLSTKPSLSQSPGIHLASANEQSLEVEFVLPDYQLVSSNAGGRDCVRINAPGMGNTGESGSPELPVQGTLVGIPQEGLPTVEVLEVEVKDIGDQVVCPAAEPVSEFDLDGQLIASGQIINWDANAYAAASFSPQNWVELDVSGMIRSQRVAQLLFQPFHYQPSTGSLQVAERIKVRVTNPAAGGQSAQARAAAPIGEGYFEPVLEGSLLNYQQARSWRSEPASASLSQAAPQAGSSQPAYKFLVKADGMYKVTYEDLVDAGMLFDGVDPRTFQLANKGSEVAIYVEGEANGVFDPGEFILFYGTKEHTKFSATNVYWLTWGSGTGQRMATIDGTPDGSGSEPTKFTTTVHLEQNKTYRYAEYSGPDLDHWYWDSLQVSGAAVTKVFTTTLSNVSGETGTIQVSGLFRGLSASPEHRAKIYLNDQLVSTLNWAAGTEVSFDFAADQSDLVNGTNKISVEGVYESGLSQTFFVNWFDITYADSYTADNDRLFFDGEGAGTKNFLVKGFSSNLIHIYDITTPDQPVEILNGAITNPEGPYQVNYKQTITGDHAYLAEIEDQWIKKPDVVIVKDNASSLKELTNSTDYLLITNSLFLEQANLLADFRRGQGYRLQVIDVQDIYDEFNYGIFSPEAIHDFIAFAYASWTRPAPSYVLLMGDGHYDFLNYRGTSSEVYMPPYIGEFDPWSGETAADNRYVTVSGSDSLPDLYLGRLPVRSTTEALAMVNKIKNYENNAPVDNWNEKILFAADNFDDGGDFDQLSDSMVAKLPPSYITDKVYLGENYADGPLAKAAIKAAINQGRLMVSYIGHGSTQWWAAEKILELNDVTSLTNSDRLPFMVPMTCWEGYFIHPGASALAEWIVRADQKGAIASWSPTGQGVASGHDILQTGLFESIFNNDEHKLGPATVYAKLYLYANTTGHRELLDTYMLFGDPATSLKVSLPPNPATATPTSTATNTATSTSTATSTATRTPTVTSTVTPTSTATWTPTATGTATWTPTTTSTATDTPTPTETSTSTPTQTGTPPSTATDTPTPTQTSTATSTTTSTATSTATMTSTSTATSTATATATLQPVKRYIYLPRLYQKRP